VFCCLVYRRGVSLVCVRACVLRACMRGLYFTTALGWWRGWWGVISTASMKGCTYCMSFTSDNHYNYNAIKTMLSGVPDPDAFRSAQPFASLVFFSFFFTLCCNRCTAVGHKPQVSKWRLLFMLAQLFIQRLAWSWWCLGHGLSSNRFASIVNPHLETTVAGSLHGIVLGASNHTVDSFGLH